jgi:hypothetical protein
VFHYAFRPHCLLCLSTLSLSKFGILLAQYTLFGTAVIIGSDYFLERHDAALLTGDGVHPASAKYWTLAVNQYETVLQVPKRSASFY